MTDHTPTDAQLRDSLDDILYPMKAVSIEHYNTAMEMAEALINNAVREAQKCEGCGVSTRNCGECTRLWQT